MKSNHELDTNLTIYTNYFHKFIRNLNVLQAHTNRTLHNMNTSLLVLVKN